MVVAVGSRTGGDERFKFSYDVRFFEIGVVEVRCHFFVRHCFDLFHCGVELLCVDFPDVACVLAFIVSPDVTSTALEEKENSIAVIGESFGSLLDNVLLVHVHSNAHNDWF